MPTKYIDGFPVVDAKRSLKLTVTKKDISGAKTKAPENCAVAKACQHLVDVEEARVHLSRIYLKHKGAKRWLRYLTGPELKQEIIAFDRGGKFEEGNYLLARVSPNKQLGKDKRKRSRAKKRTGKSRTKPAHRVKNVRIEAGTV